VAVIFVPRSNEYAFREQAVVERRVTPVPVPGSQNSSSDVAKARGRISAGVAKLVVCRSLMRAQHTAGCKLARMLK
jgi:hypothetical protein